MPQPPQGQAMAPSMQHRGPSPQVLANRASFLGVPRSPNPPPMSAPIRHSPAQLLGGGPLASLMQISG